LEPRRASPAPALARPSVFAQDGLEPGAEVALRFPLRRFHPRRLRTAPRHQSAGRGLMGRALRSYAARSPSTWSASLWKRLREFGEAVWYASRTWRSCSSRAAAASAVIEPVSL